MNLAQINKENVSKENQEQKIPVLNGQREFSQEIQDKLEQFKQMSTIQLGNVAQNERRFLNSIDREIGIMNRFGREFQNTTRISGHMVNVDKMELEHVIKPKVSILEKREQNIVDSINQGNVSDSDLAGLVLIRRELENPSIPSFKVLAQAPNIGYNSDGSKTFSKNENGEFVSKHNSFFTRADIFISTNNPERFSDIPKEMYEKVPELIAVNKDNLKEINVEDRQSKVNEIISSNDPIKVSNLIEQLGIDGVNTMDSLNSILSAYNDESILKKFKNSLNQININELESKIDAIRNNDESILKKIENNLENLNLNQININELESKIDAIRNE